MGDRGCCCGGVRWVGGWVVRAVGPGPRSVEGLAWLARVGPASGLVWSAAMRWAPATGRSHSIRLRGAGLLEQAARLPVNRGPLLYATALGVQCSGVAAVALRKPPSMVSLEHHEACALTAAYLTRRGREMRAPRELLLDDRWVGELDWREHGELRRRRHRPDLIATVDQGRVLAIEVELSSKSPARLRSILQLYAVWLSEGRIDSLLYLVGGEREGRHLTRCAQQTGLEAGPRFGVQPLAQITDRVHALDEEVAA
jgi:hypothetical protein